MTKDYFETILSDDQFKSIRDEIVSGKQQRIEEESVSGNNLVSSCILIPESYHEGLRKLGEQKNCSMNVLILQGIKYAITSKDANFLRLYENKR